MYPLTYHRHLTYLPDLLHKNAPLSSIAAKFDYCPKVRRMRNDLRDEGMAREMRRTILTKEAQLHFTEGAPDTPPEYTDLRPAKPTAATREIIEEVPVGVVFNDY